MTILLLLIIISFSGIFILISAKKRGMLYILWGIFGFLLAPIAWIVFLIVRKPILGDKPDIDSFTEPEILD